MENIHNFLKAASSYGVPAGDLFKTADLFEGEDISQVIATIMAIARISGFCTTSSKRNSIMITPTSTKLASLPRMSLDDEGLAKIVEHLSMRNGGKGLPKPSQKKHPLSKRKQALIEKEPPVEEDLKGRKLTFEDASTKQVIEYVSLVIGSGRLNHGWN